MSHAEYQVLSATGELMFGIRGYAQPLRAIGQALEVLNIQDFEMEPLGDEYFVRGRMSLPEGESENSSASEKLEAVWGEMPDDEELGGNDGQPDRPTLSWIELCYTARDVQRLEEEGRLRRGCFEKIADAPSLSQVLRSVGAYLSQKRARLRKISRETDGFVLEYETSLGSEIKELLAPTDLYDLWVRMYLQRSGRVTRE